ncbi:hypothetical protein RND81_02G232800 [Saponaria officinalis]|uniref:Uncharacterized protein n=1 Tax=Saponaria officinalis TaxID=3572 RepID=A0AAW1MY87_SAPOF
MTNLVFPLCWESTGDQWWYATPIDWAAANGLCDLVKELLRIDPNLLIKLTSLSRIRRLETVWENNLGPGPHNGVAQCRARVARSLLLDCEPKSGNGEQKNTLIRAGYGGWLLYTAASAGDVEFVMDLVERDPLVVFGKGEYGITDILYAAARSGNSEVFRVLLEYAMDVNKSSVDADGNFVEEMICRAVHAAARGGNLEILKELLLNCSDVSGFRDCQGYTLLHSAAGKGQIEVVKDLIKTYDIIGMTDNHGNTALHIAAYKGHSSVVETLILASPKLATSRNDDGDTFLHIAVAGFQSRGFHQIDQQFELMKTLANNKLITSENVVNITNNEGKTALHVAVAMNIHCNVVDILMGFPSVDLYIWDIDGCTPMDLLKRRPKTAPSAIQGIGTSPGTSFRFHDSDLLSCTGDGNESDFSCEPSSSRFSSCSSEQITTHFDSERSKKRDFTNSASKRFKFRLQWPMRVDRSSSKRNAPNKPISLRQRFTKTNGFPSPTTREKFAASLMQGVIQAKPPNSGYSSVQNSPSTPYLESSLSSPTSADDVKGDIGNSRTERRSRFFSGPLNSERLATMDDKHRRVSSFSKSLMNQYFCFGAQGLAVEVEDSVSYKRENRSCRRLVF